MLPDHLVVRSLGLADYQRVWDGMKAFTEARDATSADEIWLLEHPPVFTLGQAGLAEHLLAPGDIPVIQVDRGGQVTYHGPGQLVGYLMIDIRRLGVGVRGLVDVIEGAIVDVLADYGVHAAPRADAPGVYVDGAKIASLGLRVRRGCSFHGLALNLDMDLEPFKRINPCGYAGLEVVRLKDLVDAWQSDESARLAERLAGRLAAGLGCDRIQYLDGLPAGVETTES